MELEEERIRRARRARRNKWAKRIKKIKAIGFLVVLLGSLVTAIFYFAKDKVATEPQMSPPITQPKSREWNLVLVNKENEIPSDWNCELTELSNGERVDSRVYPHLQEMFDEMRKEGIYPIVREGYRTEEEQKDILESRKEKYKSEGFSEEAALEKAKEEVAIPRTSEHQLGLALDINADTAYSADNEVYEWLAEYAYKFGFILRYPSGKQDITGIIYEPWHYRYVGEEAALEMKETGVCLEEYLGVE